jgi:lipopolysaccharide transport system permease protein
LSNNPENTTWTEIITPKKGLLDFNLKEVWDYRDLIMLFVRRDFVSSYKQTVLGPIWFFIQPLLTSVIFIVIFTQIAQLPTAGVPPLLFFLTGITLWNYFSESLTKTSNAFIQIIVASISYIVDGLFGSRLRNNFFIINHQIP